MSHSHARSPQEDYNGNFVHDTKGGSGVGLTNDGTSHNPHASYRFTPDLESESDEEETPVHAAPDVYLAGPNRIVLTADQPILTGPRVRFRSRVRISAGMGRRRRRRSDGLSSNESSISGSPSSSISAPLRTHYTGNNGWGPLGSRVKFAASQAAATPLCQDDDADGGKGNPNWNGDEGTRRSRARSSWSWVDDGAGERAQLLTTTARFSYVGGYTHNGYHVDYERERERWLREQLIDDAFGKWPGRLLNRHWWWWHLEPVLCCLCELDDE